MAKFVAKLVTITLCTRVLVPAELADNDDAIFQLAKPRLKEKAAEEMLENIESVVDDTEMPYEEGEEHLDMNGSPILEGNTVLVPDPIDDDLYDHAFEGTVDSFSGDYVVVRDGDGQFHQIEAERLEVQQQSLKDLLP